MPTCFGRASTSTCPTGKLGFSALWGKSAPVPFQEPTRTRPWGLIVYVASATAWSAALCLIPSFARWRHVTAHLTMRLDGLGARAHRCLTWLLGNDHDGTRLLLLHPWPLSISPVLVVASPHPKCGRLEAWYYRMEAKLRPSTHHRTLLQGHVGRRSSYPYRQSFPSWTCSRYFLAFRAHTYP